MTKSIQRKPRKDKGVTDKPWMFKKGFAPWNKGTGGCKKGHSPDSYVKMPNGPFVCLECKRENGAKYRKANRQKILDQNRVDRYGITQEYLGELYKKQNGRCDICQKEITMKKARIDHDHKSGNVRGLLCVSCNTGIGLLQDSVGVLESAIKYILKK